MKFKPTPEQIRSWVSANFEYKERKNGDELVINNPFDGDDGFHMNINTQKSTAHCWKGDSWAQGGSKTFLRFVQLYRKCSFIDALKEVCGDKISISTIYNKLNRAKLEQKEERKYDIKLPDGSRPLIDNKQTKIGGMLIGWLRSRGINEDMIKQYNLHFHSTYVVWPYYEYGTLVYWQERDRLNKIFRFPSESVGVTKGMFLYGFDMVEPGDRVIVTEAIFDSMTLRDQIVASGGAILTETQAYKIRALNPVNGIILAPDNDEAGLKSIINNYKLLYPYYKMLYSIPPKSIILKDGSEREIKDWNNLIEDTGLTQEDVIDIFKARIKPLTPQALTKLI